MSRFFILGAAVAMLPVIGFCGSISIMRSVTQVSGSPNTFVYTYTVSNDGSLPGGEPIQAFDIYFDPTIYNESSLQNVTPEPLNSQWLPQILFSVGSVPAAFDVEAQNGGITAGNSLGGFAVEFTSLSPNLPAVQAFDIYDPANFAQPIFSGFTSTVGPVAPEPSSFSLALVVLILASAVWAVRLKHSPDSRRQRYYITTGTLAPIKAHLFRARYRDLN